MYVYDDDVSDIYEISDQGPGKNRDDDGKLRNRCIRPNGHSF